MRKKVKDAEKRQVKDKEKRQVKDNPAPQCPGFAPAESASRVSSCASRGHLASPRFAASRTAAAARQAPSAAGKAASRDPARR